MARGPLRRYLAEFALLATVASCAGQKLNPIIPVVTLSKATGVSASASPTPVQTDFALDLSPDALALQASLQANVIVNSTTTELLSGRRLQQQVPGSSVLRFFGECLQDVLTKAAECTFVFDFSARRALDLIAKVAPAGLIPGGGTVSFQFCTISLGETTVSSPTCFESHAGTYPTPVTVKIATQAPAAVVPAIGFSATYTDSFIFPPNISSTSPFSFIFTVFDTYGSLGPKGPGV